jgi:hypothetical protein
VRTLIYNTRMVVPMDDARSRLPNGYVLVKDQQIERVGSGAAPTDVKIERFVDARGKIALPGLVNAHHHLPQTLTRNVPRVQEAPLFRWLVELYEVWRGLDARAVEAARPGGPGRAAAHRLHHDRRPPLPLPARPGPAHRRGDRGGAGPGHPVPPHAGSMSRGKSQGGLPPDDVVQDEGVILEDSRRLIRDYHDPRPGP